VEFLGRRAAELMTEARTRLAAYLACAPDEVVYFPNPTTALNMVARSLPLRPGDEVLATDHEYGALDRTWRFLCAKAGARYIRQAIGLPIESAEAVVEAFWSGVSERTRLVFLSHITSPTALTFPVAEICRRARQAGLLVIVDGAHAPGHIPLDLPALGADVYAGACHKWLCAPKGASFLYARRSIQPRLEPLVVSWGWEAEKPSPSPFVDHHEWQAPAYTSAPRAGRSRGMWPGACAPSTMTRWPAGRAGRSSSAPACHLFAPTATRGLHRWSPPGCLRRTSSCSSGAWLRSIESRSPVCAGTANP
jgi:isopenicillin-N epimerase